MSLIDDILALPLVNSLLDPLKTQQGFSTLIGKTLVEFDTDGHYLVLRFDDLTRYLIGSDNDEIPLNCDNVGSFETIIDKEIVSFDHEASNDQFDIEYRADETSYGFGSWVKEDNSDFDGLVAVRLWKYLI